MGRKKGPRSSWNGVSPTPGGECGEYNLKESFQQPKKKNSAQACAKDDARPRERTSEKGEAGRREKKRGDEERMPAERFVKGGRRRDEAGWNPLIFLRRRLRGRLNGSPGPNVILPGMRNI